MNRYTEIFNDIKASEDAKRRAVKAMLTADMETGSTASAGKCSQTVVPKTKSRFFDRKWKIAIAFSTAAVLVFCAVLIPLFSRGSISSQMFENCVFRTSGARGLGIVQAGPQPGIGDKGLLALSLNAAYAEENKDWMIVYNDDGTIKEVIFYRYREDGDSEEVTQRQISAPIKKLCVTEKFTFIMFSLVQDGSPDEKRQPDYQSRGYCCDSRHSQSFVIDNATGKVYSLEPLFQKYDQTVFMDVFEDCVFIEYAHGSVVERHVYVIDVEDSELVFSRLYGNRDNKSNNIYFVEDRFGHYFVAAEFNETSERILHFKNPYEEMNDLNFKSVEGTIYGKGSDGFVYKVTVTGSESSANRNYSILRIGENFEEIEIESDINVGIQLQSQQYSPDIGPRQTILLRGGKLYHILCDNGQGITVASLSEGEYRESGRLDLPGGYGMGKKEERVSMIIVSQGEIFYIGHKEEVPPSGYRGRETLYHFDLVTGRETIVLENIHRTVVTRGALLVYNGPAQGVDYVPQGEYATKAYTVRCAERKISTEVLFEIPDDMDIITLQPFPLN